MEGLNLEDEFLIHKSCLDDFMSKVLNILKNPSNDSTREITSFGNKYLKFTNGKFEVNKININIDI